MKELYRLAGIIFSLSYGIASLCVVFGSYVPKPETVAVAAFIGAAHACLSWGK